MIEIKGLTGINGEKLIYDEVMVKNFILSIDALYKDIEWDEVRQKENFLLDCYSSATIEGAFTSIDRIKKGIKGKSELMVINCMNGAKYIAPKKVNIQEIINTWNIVVENVCENENLRGNRFRTGMVYIGNQSRVVHTPSPVNKIETKMKDLERFISSHTKNVIDTCIVHFYLVYIHPFCDGNGRTARILQSAILDDIGYNNIWNVPISNTIINNINGYYKALEKSERVNRSLMDITPFISYMLRVIEFTLHDLKESYGKSSSLEMKIYNFMSKHSGAEISVRKVVERFNVSEQHARKTLNLMVNKRKLIKIKIGNTNYYRINLLK